MHKMCRIFVFWVVVKRDPFCFGIWKNKSQLIAWEINPEAYCRQHLLNMQVKLNTHHWGIQWNSLVMQVKKATFQRMGSGGKGRTENRGGVSKTACTTGSVFYFYGKYIKKSQRLTVRATTDCSWWHSRALFCKPSRTYTSSNFGPLGSYAVSAELHGVTKRP